MATIRVNGGIINKQVLAGSLRYFKMVGPFAWAVSDGTVNLPVVTSGGNPDASTYMVVGDDLPVPKSAAEQALSVISKKCTISIIGLVGTYGGITEVHFAVENSSIGWGSDTPSYSTPPANQPEDPAAAAVQMQAAVRELAVISVYSSVGAVTNNTLPPVFSNADMGTVTVIEVPFRLA